MRAFVVFLSVLLSWQAAAGDKPFRRALVLGGGGISPGVALGMIAGAKAAGYEPDVIMTSCGASLGASLYSGFATPEAALVFAKSETFYRELSALVRFDSWTVFGLKRKFDGVAARPEFLPELFRDNILDVPESVAGLIPRDRFPTGKTKLIIVAAHAGFGPQDTGKRVGANPIFREVLMTDAHTARAVDGIYAPVREIFPDSRVAPTIEALSGVGMSQAARASITDPYYINPARIGNEYYFGGAVDLFPIETASEIADEVLVNFPTGLYSSYEDLAIESVFGFEQSLRTELASKHTDVKWIDSSGTNDLAMDPTVSGIFFAGHIPHSLEEFRALIDKQYRFGYARAVEAVKLQRTRNNVRSHLRQPFVGRAS